MDKKAERLLCDAYHRGRLAEIDDKHHKNKKVVVIEKVRDKYGSVVALKVVLYCRHDGGGRKGLGHEAFSYVQCGFQSSCL